MQLMAASLLKLHIIYNVASRKYTRIAGDSTIMSRKRFRPFYCLFMPREMLKLLSVL